MRQIRIAAQVHPQQGTWADLRASAIEAERLGYDVVAWVDGLIAALGPAPGASVNFVGDEGPERVHDSYPGATWNRLPGSRRRRVSSEARPTPRAGLPGGRRTARAA